MQYTGCRPLSDEEYHLILNSFEGKYVLRDQALFELGIRTGFRISEMLSVRVSDVFRDGQMLPALTVKKSWMKGGKNDRTMPLHSIASKRLHDWILEASYESWKRLINQFSPDSAPLNPCRLYRCGQF